MKPGTSSLQIIKELIGAPEPIRWVFAGDSITHGALHTFGWRDYTELFAERVRWELQRMRDVVIKTGVSGWRVPDLMGDLNWSVLQHRPDVLSIALGMNDCAAGGDAVAAFALGLKQIVNDALAHLPEMVIILHTPPRILPLDVLRSPHLAEYVAAIREVASESGAVLVDHYQAWAAEEQNGKLAYWLSDAIHPNEIGHRAMARLLLRELSLWGDEGVTSKLLIV